MTMHAHVNTVILSDASTDVQGPEIKTYMYIRYIIRYSIILVCHYLDKRI